MPGLPPQLAGLVADLERLGFEVVREEWHAWPRGGDVELRRVGAPGVRAVRLMEDRGIWDVEAQLGRGWYEPFTAVRALGGVPHEQRALGNEERRAAVLDLVGRFTGERGQIRAVKARTRQLNEAYTRWASGKSDVNPLQ